MRPSLRFNWSWRSHAKCLGDDIMLYDLSALADYWKVHGWPPKTPANTIAATLCADCPVIRECAADALVDRPRPVGVVRGGVWCSPAYWRRTSAALAAVAGGDIPAPTTATRGAVEGTGARRG